MKQAPLIELFSGARKNAATEYLLTYVYTKHTRPDITKTLTVLADHVRSRKPYQFHPNGRASPYEAPDLFLQGFTLMNEVDNEEDGNDTPEDEGPGLEMEDLLALD